MNLAEWEFLDRLHPANTRPPGAMAWDFAPPGWNTALYKTSASGNAVEPLQMGLEGNPSVELYRTPGGETIEKVVLHSDAAAEVDIAPIQQVADQWLQGMKDLSQGSYSLEDLRHMGHPYGYGDKREPLTWRKLSRPRDIPRQGWFVGTSRNRQRITDRDVVNIAPDRDGGGHTGNLLRRFAVRITRWYGGVTVQIVNTALYAWWLAHGTSRMQAHGPWGVVAQRMLWPLRLAWMQAAKAAWRRRRANEAMFDAASLDSQQREFEAGGFA